MTMLAELRNAKAKKETENENIKLEILNYFREQLNSTKFENWLKNELLWYIEHNSPTKTIIISSLKRGDTEDFDLSYLNKKAYNCDLIHEDIVMALFRMMTDKLNEWGLPYTVGRDWKYSDRNFGRVKMMIDIDVSKL